MFKKAWTKNMEFHFNIVSFCEKFIFVHVKGDKDSLAHFFHLFSEYITI